MARVVGYGGQVQAPGAIAGIREWSIDYVAATPETSGYDTGQDKTFLVGQREWSGSFGGLKNQAPLVCGAAIRFKFYEIAADATRLWEGDGFITSVRAASVVDGVVTYAYDFQGTATLVNTPTA